MILVKNKLLLESAKYCLPSNAVSLPGKDRGCTLVLLSSSLRFSIASGLRLLVKCEGESSCN